MFRYYTAIIFLNIFAMVIIQTCINHSNTLTESRKKTFYQLFNAIIIAAFCEWFGNYLQGTGSSTRILHIIVKAVELSVAPSIGFFVAWIIEKKKEKQIYIYLIIHAVLEFLSGFSGFIYYVDENSNYIHADFYWIYILAYMVSIAYGIYVVMRNLKRYQYNGGGYFLLVAAFMLTGIIVQLCDSNLKVDYVVLGLASSMLYVLTLEMINQTDELTELINRRGYENYISHVERKCIVLFLDIDNFKMLNDTYGHALGDTILRWTGKAIRSKYAKYGKCFRYGGDEFCVIINQNLEQIDKINIEFFDKLMELREKEKRFPYISVGYAYYDPEIQNIQEIVSEADQMMYQNKKNHNTLQKSKG